MAFIDPDTLSPAPQSTEGPTGFIDPDDEEGSGTKMRKGSFKDQVHDIASGGTAVLDLLTMLPGMVGGAIGTGVGMAVHGSKQPAQDLLTGIGEGGERSSASNLLGINESDPNYRERPGYKAVMKPVEALTQGMHLAGQGVEKAASAGWLGSDRTRPEVARELGAGTELGLLAALPFMRGPKAAPGSARAYREVTERPKQGERAREEARDSYPAEEPTKPFDMRDFKEPVMEEFAPEFRPGQFEGAEEAIMTPAQRGLRDTRGTEDPFIKSEPKLTEQDYFGTTEPFRNTKEVRPTRDFDDIPHQIDKRGNTVSPQHEAPRSDRLPSVMRDAETAADPLTFRSYDPNRISDQVSASEKPGFLRSAEEVMRARELERAEMPRDRSNSGPKPANARIEDWNITDFISGRLGKTLLDDEIRDIRGSWPSLQKRFEALPEVKEYSRLDILGDEYRAREREFTDTKIPANNSHYSITDLAGVMAEKEYWLKENKEIFKDVELAISWLEHRHGIQPPKTFPKQNRVRKALEIIQRTSETPYYRTLAKKILADPEFKPDFEIVSRHAAKKGEFSGRYIPKEHKIQVSELYVGSEQLHLHEAMHARVFSALEAFENYKGRIFKTNMPQSMQHLYGPTKRIYDLYDSLKAAAVEYPVKHMNSNPMGSKADRAGFENPLWKLNEKYGLKDVHEFVSEGFTNPAFQASLAQIKLPKHLQTKGLRFYWDAFVNTVSEMFGFKGKEETYLSELLRAGADLMSGMGKSERLYYADMVDTGKTVGGPSPKDLQRRGGPVKALQEEAREMSLEGRHNTPIEKVVEKVASGKIEDFTAERSNQFWNAVARMGSLVKENLLIDTSIRQIMKDKQGSGPLIKWAVDSVSHIEREAVKMTKAAVNEGLTDLRRMYNSKHLRQQGMEMIRKWQENIGVRDLTKADFTTDRQWQTYSKIRAQDDLLLERVNAIRAQSKDADGKPLEPIARIPSHFRGMWEGDYRVFAYDGAGNKKFAQGFDTEWSAKKVAAEMQKKHPELTVKSDHVKTDQYGIPNLSGFEDAIRIMSQKNDPVAKALQATYHQILQRRGFGRTGVHRKGVKGGLGSEGGLLGFRNTERALEEHFNQGYRYIANLEKQKVLADLQAVPKEIWDKMPQTKEFLESYVRKTQGKKLRDDGWIDSALIGLSRAIGTGEHGPLKAVRGISTVATLWWLTTPRFLISQSVQSLNAVPKLIQRFGHVDAAGAYFTGLNRALFEGARDASSKEAIKWAAERGYLDATIHNLMEKGWSGRPIGSMAESIKEVMSWPAMGIERKLVRTPTFLAFEHALRDKIKDKVQRFEEAAEAADYYMVNYGGSHTPMAYNKMGLTGDAAKPLKQYAHNTWGQFFEYARNAKNKGEVAPLAWFMGIQASVAGLKGMMIVAEVTAVISLLNYMFDLDIPTPEQLMLRGGLHEALVHGGLSYVLQHDVSASVSAPGIPNMFSAPPIQFTTRVVQDLGNYVWKKANGEDTDQDRLRALLAITPNAMHEWVKWMYQEEGQPTPNPYDPNLRGNYRRSEGETWAANIIGAKPLDEAKADAIMRAVKQDLQRDMRQKNNAGEAIVDRVMNGQEIPEKLMQKYIEQGGNVAGLPKFIMNKIKERNMTGAERHRDIRSITPNNAHRLDTLNDYLNEIDDRLNEGGGYRWDPETGEIVPISMTDMGDGFQNNHNVNDSEPPSRRNFPKLQDIDKRMKTGSKERSASEYRTPQLNPEKFYAKQLSKRKFPLENAIKDRIKM